MHSFFSFLTEPALFSVVWMEEIISFWIWKMFLVSQLDIGVHIYMYCVLYLVENATETSIY